MVKTYPESMREQADLRLIHALQLEPRASWTDLGRALLTDPVALARRWARITEEGLAWTSGYRRPTHTAVAVIEIECVQGRAAEIARLLAAESAVLTVDHTSGGCGDGGLEAWPSGAAAGSAGDELGDRSFDHAGVGS